MGGGASSGRAISNLLHFYTAIPNLLNLLLHFYTAILNLLNLLNLTCQTCWLRSAEHEAKW